jgi:hypothetical protein
MRKLIAGAVVTAIALGAAGSAQAKTGGTCAVKYNDFAVAHMYASPNTSCGLAKSVYYSARAHGYPRYATGYSAVTGRHYTLHRTEKIIQWDYASIVYETRGRHNSLIWVQIQANLR